MTQTIMSIQVGKPLEHTLPVTTPTVIPADRAPGLLSLLAEDWRAHGSGFTKAGLHSILVYRLGWWADHLPKFVRIPFQLIHRPMFWFCRNFYGIEIPSQAKLGRRVIFAHQSGIVVHQDTVIGDDCIIRHNVTFGIKDHGGVGVPTLGNRVETGCGSVMVGPIKIGDDAKIGANAVVIHDVPAGHIAVGIPAKIIAPRTSPRQTIPSRNPA